jgi:spore germination protein KC
MSAQLFRNLKLYRSLKLFRKLNLNLNVKQVSKQISVSCLVILLTFGATGCWDSSEIDQLAIVTTSGVDVKNAESGKPVYTVSLQIARTSKLGVGQSGMSGVSTGTTKTFVTMKRDGSDILMSLDSLQSQIARKAIRTHRLAVVLGESFARYGISPVLDEIVRHPGSRLRSFLLVAYHGEASTILGLPNAFSRMPSEALVNMEKQGMITESTTKDFVEKLNGKGDPWLPGMEPEEADSGTEPNTFNLSHIALFQRDKLVGWLDKEDIVGFKWLTNNVKGSIISVEIPGHKGTVNGETISEKATPSVRLVKGKPVINIRLNVREETVATGTNLNMRDPANIVLVEGVFTQEIKKQCEDALDKLQHQYESDALDFGDLIYRRYPKVWYQLEPHWREEYSHIPVNVRVVVKILNTGSSGPSSAKNENW